MKRGKRWLVISVIALAVVGTLAGAGYYLTHSYDPGRVAYKRWKAPNKYVFEEIAPRFRKTDPATLIGLQTRQGALDTRRTLARAIWGPRGLPRNRLPKAVERAYKLGGLGDMPNLARVDRLAIPVGDTYVAFAYLLKPERSNRRVILYQHGYAGTIVDAKPWIAPLVAQGFTVIGLNNYNYGENRTSEAFFPRFGHYRLYLWDFMNLLEHPMRVYFEPIVVSINHAARELGVDHVDMIGFSNGGWMTMVAAAMDPRIRRSYPVAGAYPIYLRSGETKVNQPEHFYRPMLQAANYMEMFVLAALEPGRRQMQVFNRFDRCCWRNVKARLYEPAVKAAVQRLGGGSFRVLIDETHADHKISRSALDNIVADLSKE